MTPTPDPTHDPARAEHVFLAAALRGTLAGAARAIITWLLDHYAH
jgi:hypothetical protein